MAATWTLAVEKLGKIRNAEIRVSPLTLFVGENNTGKSYLANLIWGVMKYLPWANTDKTLESYQICADWVLRNYPHTTLLSSEDQKLFAKFIHEATSVMAPNLVRYCFSKNDFELGAISINIHESKIPLRVKWAPSDARPAHDTIAFMSHNESDERQLEFYVDSDQAKDKTGLVEHMVYLIANAVMTRDLPSRSLKDAYFLPASRTGYMLLYPTIADYSLEWTFGRQSKLSGRESLLRLPRSIVEFVKIISNGLRDEKGKYAAEADALEKELRGNLELRPGTGLNQYYYHSEDGHEITMSLASSMVTELAPIILLLRYAPDISLLVLEEPEVHLHPIVQRKLAVTIARLIRNGVRVLITTHSDLFCHQINNLIKLGAHPQRAEMLKKLGYSENDYLLPDEVSGYDFRHVEQHTEVSPLKMTEFGLEMPTFNDELRSLVTESRALEAQTEEAQ